MSNANQEIIEARLASYIDDEIDVGERAEIEQHLQQNPQYRRLLDELRKGRQMVRALPRETAPGEFADAFFVQLERSGLLDGGGEPAPSRMRLDMWPRWAAAAAVVFLTVGLAGILYFMLPHHDPQQIAYVPKPLPENVETPTARAKEDGAAKVDAIPDTPKPLDAVAVAPAVAAPSEASKAKDAAGQGASTDPAASPVRDLKHAEPQVAQVSKSITPSPAPVNELDRLASAISHDPQFKDLLAETETAPVPNAIPSHLDAVVMVVQANDPARIQKELNAYLAGKNLEYQHVPAPVTLALNASLLESGEGAAKTPADRAIADEKNAVREKTAAMEKKQETLSDANPGTTGAPSQARNALPAHMDEPGAPGLGHVAPKPAAVTPAARAEPIAGAQQAPQPTAPAAPAGGMSHAPPGSPPSSVTNTGRPFGGQPPPAAVSPAAGAAAPATKSAAPVTNNPQQLQRATAATNPANAAPANSFLVVRKLTPLQARELNDRLARSGEVRAADISRQPDGDYRYAQGNMPTSIRPDGGKGAAAPMGADALAKASTDKDKSALREQLGQGRGAGAGPTTRQSNGLAVATAATLNDVRRKTMESASRPSFAGTTQPAADADADRLIDVVIVLRNSSFADANPTFPATAPSAPPQKAASPAPTTQPAPPTPFSSSNK